MFIPTYLTVSTQKGFGRWRCTHCFLWRGIHARHMSLEEAVVLFWLHPGHTMRILGQRNLPSVSQPLLGSVLCCKDIKMCLLGSQNTAPRAQRWSAHFSVGGQGFVENCMGLYRLGYDQHLSRGSEKKTGLWVCLYLHSYKQPGRTKSMGFLTQISTWKSSCTIEYFLAFLRNCQLFSTTGFQGSPFQFSNQRCLKLWERTGKSSM